jgi:hypothetical protein
VKKEQQIEGERPAKGAKGNAQEAQDKITVTHVNGLPTQIPNTLAWQRCVDVLHSLAKKMWNTGNEATSKFIETNLPAAKTVGKEYADRKFKRIVECEDGSLVTVIYDYMTQTTWA